MSVLSCSYFGKFHILRTHLWVGCVCCEVYCFLPDLKMYHCVLVVILGMLKALSEASGSWLDVPRVYVICSFVTPGMSGPICEWAVFASCVRYIFLLSLLRVCVICSCCHSRHEWTHLWVGCICLVCALYLLLVTVSMSGPICEWAVSASSLCYILLLSLLAWVDPSVSGLYLLRVYVICSCCHSRHEWSHLWVGCICLVCAL